MVIRAADSEGVPIKVSFPPWVAWGAGIVASLIVVTIASTAAKLVDIENRVTAIESSRFTPEMAREMVSVREYDAHTAAMQTSLQRINEQLREIREAVSNGR